MALITIDMAVNILKKGGVVAVPTETVYGLAADATNPAAIEKIYAIKNRPRDNPLICHFKYYTEAKKYLVNVYPYVDELAVKLLPGPLSFLLKLPKNSPLFPATGGRDTVIIRIPAHPLLHQLLMQVDFPLAAPSANTSGKYSGTSAEMVAQDLGDKIDGIVDGGVSSVGLESTIIDCRNEGSVSIMRPGVIGVEEIKKALEGTGIVVNELPVSVMTTPGSKYRHYAPETPVKEINSLDEIKPVPKSLVLLLLNEHKPMLMDWMKNHPWVDIKVVYLGSLQNLNELAQQLYNHLYELDKLKAPIAYILKTDYGSSSVGKAVTNRINKILGY